MVLAEAAADGGSVVRLEIRVGERDGSKRNRFEHHPGRRQFWMVIGSEVVLDVHVLAFWIPGRVTDLAFDVDDEIEVPEVRPEQGRLRVPVRRVNGRERIGERRANSDLDAFDRIHQEQAEFAIEDVAVEDGFKRRVRFEAMAICALALLLEGQSVAGEPVVADVLECVFRGDFVANRQPAFLEQLQLGAEGERGFDEGSRRQSRGRSRNEKPALMRIVERRGRSVTTNLPQKRKDFNEVRWHGALAAQESSFRL